MVAQRRIRSWVRKNNPRDSNLLRFLHAPHRTRQSSGIIRLTVFIVYQRESG
jgi:hypothetical protein